MRLVHPVSAAAYAAIFVGLLAFVEFREACISTDEQWARLAEKEEMLNEREQKLLACNCSCADLASARPAIAIVRPHPQQLQSSGDANSGKGTATCARARAGRGTATRAHAHARTLREPPPLPERNFSTFCGDEDGACAAINSSALWGHQWTEGTTMQMIRRTRQIIGNVGRLQRFLRKLCQGTPTNVLVIGGSNCRKGPPQHLFPTLIEGWLNQAFPVRENTTGGEHSFNSRQSLSIGRMAISQSSVPPITRGHSQYKLVYSHCIVSNTITTSVNSREIIRRGRTWGTEDQQQCRCMHQGRPEACGI